MLVLSRKKSEKIRLGDQIEITVVRISGNKVRLGIHAPPDIEVLRQELGKESGVTAANEIEVELDREE